MLPFAHGSCISVDAKREELFLVDQIKQWLKICVTPGQTIK